MKTFKLPPFERFASHDKKKDPYLKFFSWIGRKIDPFWKTGCGIKLDPSKVYLSKKDEEILFALECEWGKKYGISHKEMAWHNLMFGPSIIKKPSGYVYVEGGMFKKNKE